MNLQLSQDCRPSDQLPLDQLASYLSEQLPGFMKNNRLEVKQFASGASNLTYQLFNGQDYLILRRPPFGTIAKSAHDMVREHKVLDLLQSHYSLSPRPVLVCDDESVIGANFFIMKKIEGMGIGLELPVEMSPDQLQKLCQNFVEGLVHLHQIDIQSGDLATLGKPQGYVERQLEGWQGRFVKAHTDDVMESHQIYQWLKEHLNYNSGYQSLVHNDYKFDNLILNPDKPEEIAGVLDWEMTTLGDPLLDLGCSLSYWIQADDPVELQAIRMMPTHLKGMMTRKQVFDSYCQSRNITGVEMEPYYVFGLFRLAVIAQQIYYRYYHGQTDNPKFAKFGQMINILLKRAELVIDHSI
ncbi:MAG: phosphotransferase family protein [Gammaproteobacteria bacterium]|nr:phosphotransferase family protein [Gammaproteobacteria bacterium]MDH5630241.1 phosphotransferase family protein [Gammaproteobacteria bacterium]